MIKNFVYLLSFILFFFTVVIKADDKRFSAIQSLDIENIVGNVEIVPYSGAEIIFSSDDLKPFNFFQSNGTLKVLQEASKKKLSTYNVGGVSVVNVGNGNVSNVTIGGDDFSSNIEPAKKLIIKVPDNKMPIYIKNATGNWQIGDLNSSLFVSLTSADVKIGKVSELDISITGSGSVLLDKDTSKVSVKIMGTGDFKANSGIDDLEALIEGTGNIEINGTVKDAKLNLNGVGDIKINRMSHKPEIISKGIGNIEIINKNY